LAAAAGAFVFIFTLGALAFLFSSTAAGGHDRELLPRLGA
jgi:hypothetical protein